jgi:hypothetical protein
MCMCNSQQAWCLALALSYGFAQMHDCILSYDGWRLKIDGLAYINSYRAS